MSDWICQFSVWIEIIRLNKKHDPVVALYKTYFQHTETNKLQVKEWDKLYRDKSDKAGVTILT